MYIRLSANCDKVIVLKSISKVKVTFDSEGNEIVSYDRKGNVIRSNTTVPVASFFHNEMIVHEEITAQEAAVFEKWRKGQLAKIRAKMISNAARGILGGHPVAKLRANHGDFDAKVGEFSGIIEDTYGEVEVDEIIDEVNGVGDKKAPVVDVIDFNDIEADTATEIMCDDLNVLSQKMMRRILNDKKSGGKVSFSHDQILKLFATASVFRKCLDSRMTGFKCEGNLTEKDVSVFNRHLIDTNSNITSGKLFDEMKQSMD